MKIEIDLNDILGDEYGAETLAESVRRQIVDKLAKVTAEKVDAQINDEISALITAQIEDIVKAQMPTLVDQLLDAEYTPVDKWGRSKGTKTTVRDQLLQEITEQMQYKPNNYSNPNLYTASINNCVEKRIKEFKAEFGAKVDEMFAKEALSYAVTKVSEKLGLAKK